MAEDPAELENVFESREESEAWAVQGLLNSAGIDAVVQSLEAPQDVLPGVGNIVVRVPAEQAADAREIVASYQSNPPAIDEMQSDAGSPSGSGGSSASAPTKIPSPS